MKSLVSISCFLITLLSSCQSSDSDGSSLEIEINVSTNGTNQFHFAESLESPFEILAMDSCSKFSVALNNVSDLEASFVDTSIKDTVYILVIVDNPNELEPAFRFDAKVLRVGYDKMFLYGKNINGKIYVGTFSGLGNELSHSVSLKLHSGTTDHMFTYTPGSYKATIVNNLIVPVNTTYIQNTTISEIKYHNRTNDQLLAIYNDLLSGSSIKGFNLPPGEGFFRYGYTPLPDTVKISILKIGR